MYDFSENDEKFKDIKDAENIIISEDITKIGNNFMKNLPKVIDILFMRKNITLGDNALINNEGVVVYCNYQSNIINSLKDKSINYYAYNNYYKCGINAYGLYNSTDKKLIISGVGETYDFQTSNIPWKDKNISNVEIKQNITKLGEKIFVENEDLKEIKIGENVNNIGSYAFFGDTGLNNIEINEKLTSIGAKAFYNCSSIVNINLPKTLTTIGESAFWSCTSLKNVSIPGSVYGIEMYAFQNCESLEKAKVESGVKYVGSRAFDNCKSLKEVILPETLWYISKYAFNQCISLETVDLPYGIGQLNIDAFSECTSLKEFYIPDSVTSYGNCIFRNCTGLKKVRFSKKTKNTADAQFQGCSNLEEVIIPYGVENVGNGNFRRCINLKEIKFPLSVTTIGDDNFDMCSSIERIVIPKTVTKIGRDSTYRNQDATIYCTSDSYAKQYAENNSYNIELDDTVPTISKIQEIELENGNKRVEIEANDNNEVVGIADCGYSFDGGETWQEEAYKEFEETTNIKICVRDGVGNISTSAERTVEIIPKDTEPPKLIIINVDSPTNGTYGVGQEITIESQYDENVYGDNKKSSINEANAPELLIKFGEGNEKKAQFKGANGKYITYTYTIEKGDNGKFEITKYEGNVFDEAGNCGNNGSNIPSNDRKIVADTTEPEVEIKTSIENNTVTNQKSILYTFQWNEGVSNFNEESITVTNGEKKEFKTITPTTRYTLKVDYKDEGNQIVNIEKDKVKDLAGNTNKEANKSIMIDTVAPEIILKNEIEPEGSEVEISFYDKNRIIGWQVTDTTDEPTEWDGNIKDNIVKYKFEKGIRYIWVKDEAGNISNKKIMSKGEKPKISGVENEKTYVDQEVTPNITAEYEIESITVKKDNEKIEYKKGDKISEEGEYEITVKDNTGATNTITFSIIKSENIIKTQKYNIEDKIIKNIEKDTNVKKFKNNISIDKKMNYKILNEENEELTGNDLIGTGTKVKIYSGDYETQYKICVEGDINGDGKVDEKDIQEMDKHRKGKKELQSVYFDAGDLNDDGKIDLKDILINNKTRFGRKENIEKSTAVGNLKTSISKVKPGDTFTVTLSLNCDEGINSVSGIKINYNKDILELISSNIDEENFINIGEGETADLVVNVEPTIKTANVQTLEFKVKENTRAGAVAKVSTEPVEETVAQISTEQILVDSNSLINSEINVQPLRVSVAIEKEDNQNNSNEGNNNPSENENSQNQENGENNNPSENENNQNQDNGENNNPSENEDKQNQENEGDNHSSQNDNNKNNEKVVQDDEKADGQNQNKTDSRNTRETNTKGSKKTEKNGTLKNTEQKTTPKSSETTIQGKQLPKTGIITIFGGLIFTVTGVSVLFYIKYKSLR